MFRFKWNKGICFMPDDGATIGGIETVSTPTGTVSTEGQAVAQPSGGEQPASFAQYAKIDLNSIPAELRPVLEEKISNIDKTFTKTMQEISPIKKLVEQSGMSADQLTQAAQLLNYLQNDPEGFYKELGSRLTPQQVQQMQQVQQIQQAQTHEPENPYASEEWYQRAVADAEARAVKKLEEAYGPKLQTLEQREKEREKAAFETEVGKAIEGLIGNNAPYADCGLTKEQIIDAAAKNGFPPSKMKYALIEAMGQENYDNYMRKKIVTDYTQTAQQVNSQVSTTISNGTPVTEKADISNMDWKQLAQVVKDNLKNSKT